VSGVDSIDNTILASLKVNIHANIFTALVFGFTPLIDASLSICLARSLQLIISGTCHQHIDVAFNLLSGGPVDLAVLLRTLHPVHLIVKLDAAAFAACHLIHVASCPESLSVRTGVCFKTALGFVTFCVNILMFSDSCRASSMLLSPLCVASGCPRNVRLKHVAHFAAAWVMNDHAFFLVAIWALEVVNPEVQLITLDNFVNVLCMDVFSAFFMLGLGALHEPKKFIDLGLVIIVSTVALVPTCVKFVNSFLVGRVFRVECPLDVAKEELLDGLECLLNVGIQFDSTTVECILGHTITEEL
jgi:hypothetical protein